MKNLKVEKNVAVFEAFYPLNLSLFGVKRGFNCSIPFHKIHGSLLTTKTQNPTNIAWDKISGDFLIICGVVLHVY